MSSENKDHENTESQLHEQDQDYDLADSGEVSDEWSDDLDQEIEDDSQQETNQPQKKKSKSTIFIILAVAIIGVFGFIFLKGGANTAQDNVVVSGSDIPSDTPIPPNDLGALQNSNSELNPQDTAIQNQPIPPISEPTKGLMDSPEIVNQVESPAKVEAKQEVTDIAEAANADPVFSETSQQLKENIDTTQNPVEPIQNQVTTVITPDIKPISDFPTADAIKKTQTENILPSPVLPVTTNIDEPENLPMIEASTTQSDNSKVQDIQSKLDEAIIKITELEKKIEVQNIKLKDGEEEIIQKTKNESDSQISSLQSKVADLEAKIAAQSTKQEGNKVILPDEKINKEDDLSQLNIIMKKDSSIKKSIIVEKNSSENFRPKWVLKSAKNGSAMIANQTTGDLKSVNVGSIIEGIGKVKSISEIGNAWVILGTQGKIKE